MPTLRQLSGDLLRRWLTYGNDEVTIPLCEYIDRDGTSPFARWFAQIDVIARAKVATHLKRMALGNLSNVTPVGGGVCEKKIDWGPGYRIYFAREGDAFVILLGGSTKSGQGAAIAQARALWNQYRQRRRSTRAVDPRLQ